MLDLSDESDNALLPNDVPSYQNQGTTIRIKGPNISSTNISSLSFGNNVMTSTLNMPWHPVQPRYAESAYMPRNMSYMRERPTSPMSLHSASGMQPRNFNPFHNSRGTSYRSGSPMSTRTVDSTASMSARDIALALQVGNYNQSDLRIIKDAFNRYMKSRVRRRVEKRRNMRKFIKAARRRSGGDSGEQASDSSISSDDCKSIRSSRSTIYKGQTSSCRSTRTDISELRRTIRESNLVQDRSFDFRQNNLKNVSVSRGAWQNLQQHKLQNTSSMSQKERFQTGFLLPSQRFNQAVASLPIPIKPIKMVDNNMMHVRSSTFNQNGEANRETDSEQEEIFANVTVVDKSSINNNGKRNREDLISLSTTKRQKVSPKSSNPTTTAQLNNFEFAKPQLPAKKSTIAKQQKPAGTPLKAKTAPKPKECIESTSKTAPKSKECIESTSKTAPKPKECIESTSKRVTNTVEECIEQVISSCQKADENLTSITPEVIPNTANEKQLVPMDTTQNLTIDRSSFIKRKLFTQKVDAADKNSSSDSLQTDSPQTNVYSKIQKEKHKPRKIVTSLSCLNRDVGDDSNLLDLIHKVVPADRMNITTVANRTDLQNNKSKPNSSDKFDVTSLITTCINNDDISDTYTDEEIFNSDNIEHQNQNEKDVSSKRKEKEQTQKEPCKKIQSGVNTKQNSCENGSAHNKLVTEQTTNKHTEKKQTNNKKLTEIMQKPIQKKKTCSKVTDNTKEKQQNITNIKKCMVIAVKLHNGNNLSSITDENKLLKDNVRKAVMSYWDTDVESDFEATPRKENPKKSVSNAVTEGPKLMTEVSGKQFTATVQKVKPSQNKTVEKVSNSTGSNFVSKQKTINLVPANKNKPTEKTAVTKITEKPLSKQEKENVPPLEDVQSKGIQLSMTPTQQSKQALQNKPTDKAKSLPKQNNDYLQTTTEKVEPRKTTNKCIEKTNNTSKTQGSSKPKPRMNQKVVKNNPNKKNPKINNNESITDKNMSRLLKGNSSDSLRRCAQRKPKVHKCCDEDEPSEKSDVHNSSMSRTLRSREVDLSLSLKSDDGNKSQAKKTSKTKNPTKRKNNRSKEAVLSDESFSLDLEVPTLNTQLRRKAPANSRMKTRQSDISFTLPVEDQNLTILTRAMKSRKEMSERRLRLKKNITDERSGNRLVRSIQ